MGLFYMKFKLVLLVLVVFLIGCNTEVADTPTKETGDKRAEVQEDKETPTKETTNGKVYSMNEDVKADYLTYKVTKAETLTEMGTFTMDKVTEGKFVKVYLKITNNAKETKKIFSPRFKLIDSQDRQFERLEEDMSYITDVLEFGVDLQPSLTVSGAIVFELPKDSRDLKLSMRGNWLSIREIRIALSNIKDIGHDITQRAEQLKEIQEI